MSESPRIYEAKVPSGISPIVYAVAAVAVIAGIVVALRKPSTPPRNSMENYADRKYSSEAPNQESWAKRYWWAILGLSILAFMIISGFVYVLFNKKDGNAEMVRINFQGLRPIPRATP
jgi:magnesium-transporting ATPase (P-type)